MKLAQATIKILLDKGLVRRMKKGISEVTADYDHMVMVKKTLRIYETLAGERKS